MEQATPPSIRKTSAIRICASFPAGIVPSNPLPNIARWIKCSTLVCTTEKHGNDARRGLK